MSEGSNPPAPLRASPITLGELANYNADEWRRLTTEALARSRYAAVALAAAKGDDVVDALGAVLGRLGRDSRSMVALVLERQLAEIIVKGTAPDEAQVSRAHDILALLGSLNTPEALDAVSTVLDDQQKPLPLRLRAADALVNCGVRLPGSIFKDVEEGNAGALIGPVLEEMRQQDPRRCLEFINSAKLEEEELVFVEYPFRQAAIDVGLPDTILLLDLTAPVVAGTMQQFFRDILAVTFGEDALGLAINEAVANTELKETISNPSAILSDEEHGKLERDVSENMEKQCGLTLLSTTAYAESLVPPTGVLLTAVQQNLRNNVRYTFYVSNHNADKISEYKERFLAALGPQQVNKDLVVVAPYQKDWFGNTVIFYFFGDRTAPHKAYQSMLAVLGSERGLALSPTWEMLSDDAAKTMLAAFETPTEPTQSSQRDLMQSLRESPLDPTPTISVPFRQRAAQ